MNALQKLRQMVGEVRQATGPLQTREAWDLVGRLLGRMPIETAEATRLCAGRDVAALEAMVARLESPQPLPQTAAQAEAQPPPDPASGAPPKDELDRALRAFRKRLKLAQLAEESKLGGRQLTSGRKSEIHAILPPHEFPSEVWRALARAGRLKHEGLGFYALP